MNEPRFPAGWNAERVKRLIDHYEAMSEDELASEDEKAIERSEGSFASRPEASGGER
jgi:hypothetical protein